MRFLATAVLDSASDAVRPNKPLELMANAATDANMASPSGKLCSGVWGVFGPMRFLAMTVLDSVSDFVEPNKPSELVVDASTDATTA